MNLKKICHAYSRFLVAFVLSGSANSSDKQEGSKDDTFSLPRSPSILKLSRLMTLSEPGKEYFLTEEARHQPSFKVTEINWQELESNSPIAYYLLQATAASYSIARDILDELPLAREKSEVVNVARVHLHNDNIEFLKDIWVELIILGSVPEEFSNQDFHKLYKNIPAHQPKLSNLNADMQAKLLAYPCCYYLMQAAVFISLKKNRLISGVESFKKINLTEDPTLLKTGNSIMVPINGYWQISSKVWEAINNLTKKEGLNFRFYTSIHALRTRDVTKEKN